MSKDRQAKPLKKKAPAKELDVELHVASQNGKTKREVIATWGDLEFTDTINPFEASARDKFIKRLGAEWEIDDLEQLKSLKTQIAQKANEADDLAEQAADEAADGVTSHGTKVASARALEDTPKEVVAAAKAFLENPKMMDELATDLAKHGIAGEVQLAATEYLVGTSRLLDKPLGASVKASSSSGKSFIAENVISLMPEEIVLAATDITQNALFYMEPGSLKHMLVFVGERKHMGADEAAGANATLALREMLSRGRLDKFVPMRTVDGIKTVHIVQEGPIAYLETTTEQEIFEEDSTRMLSLATDETSEQTAAIMEIQARHASWASGSEDERERIQQKHQTAQRLLKQLKIRIPFAERLTLPATKLVARRAFPQLLGFIEAIALLRQFQKKMHKDGHIVATANDYAIAYNLMVPILRRTFAPLSQRALILLGAIRSNCRVDQIFSRADCQQWAGVGATEARNRLNILVEAGMVDQVTGGRGVRYTYKIVSTKFAKMPALDSLITPDELRRQLKKAKKPSKAPKKKVPTAHK